MNRFIGFLLLISVLITVPASGQSPAITLSEVRDTYQSLDGLQASFTQVISSDFAGDSTQLDGTVLLSGDKYRVETPAQTVITDGTTTWIYTPADSQVVVNNADEASALTPKTFLTASAERYTVETSSPATRLGTPHVKLNVTASDSSAHFKKASLWIRRSDRIVTRMRATDRNGSTLDLHLHNITLNPEALRGETPFSFSPPDEVDVIDLRRGE